jgi:hypothetical protein
MGWNPFLLNHLHIRLRHPRHPHSHIHIHLHPRILLRLRQSHRCIQLHLHQTHRWMNLIPHVIANILLHESMHNIHSHNGLFFHNDNSSQTSF